MKLTLAGRDNYEIVMTLDAMATWAMEFSNGGYKIRMIFAKESTFPKGLLVEQQGWKFVSLNCK